MKSFLIAITVALVAALCIFSVQGGKPLHNLKLKNGVTKKKPKKPKKIA